MPVVQDDVGEAPLQDKPAAAASPTTVYASQVALSPRFAIRDINRAAAREVYRQVFHPDRADYVIRPTPWKVLREARAEMGGYTMGNTIHVSPAGREFLAYALRSLADPATPTGQSQRLSRYVARYQQSLLGQLAIPADGAVTSAGVLRFSEPELMDETASAIEDEFREGIEELLGVRLPADISYALRTVGPRRPEFPGIGWVVGGENTVNLDWNWLREHPEDIGLVLHELTHVALGSGGGFGAPGGGSSWANEGLADYVRYQLGYGQLPRIPRGGDRREVTPRTSSVPPIAQGYGAGARFFVWMNDTYPGSVPVFAQAMAQGITSNHAAYLATHTSIDQLRRDYYEDRGWRP